MLFTLHKTLCHLVAILVGCSDDTTGRQWECSDYTISEHVRLLHLVSKQGFVSKTHRKATLEVQCEQTQRLG